MKKSIITACCLLCVIGLYAVQQKNENGKMGRPPLPPDFDGEFKDFPDGFGKIPDETEPELIAAVEVSEESKTLSDQTISTDESDKSGVLAKNRAFLTLSNSVVNKTGDSSNDGQSNFYGLNGALVANSNASIVLQNVTVNSDADGSNAVFATGEDSKINAENLKIRTKKNSSRGLDATYGGKITAKNVDIETEGAHSAAFATDRGEGTIIVDGGTARTKGEGSPVIYSTGNISVRNLEGVSEGSEIAVIEGKNSITLNKVKLIGGTKNRREEGSGIMLYQSMSGDANRGTSVFRANDSVLTSTSDGAFFYITNTIAEIDLSSTTLENESGLLLNVAGNTSERGWGRRGCNGGILTFSSANQKLEGDIRVDAISKADLHFGAKTDFTGAINKELLTSNVNLKISKSATITLTGDSYVNELINEDSDFSNIESNGYTIYYNKRSKANAYLKGKSYDLKGGGKLVGIEMKETKLPTPSKKRFKKGGKRPPEPPKGKAPNMM